ncbi:MAG: hypothetical protein KJ890_15635 [Gammaproteobacteria bacterium]|nr:hypothetical protein [Gammaproteobacteria bacterium]MBU1803861.1 hypothetical protein [Gammaproteobacteria bacterium]
MTRILLEGPIGTARHGEAEDLVAIAGVSLAGLLASLEGLQVTVRYYISDVPVTLEQADLQLIEVLHGAADGSLCPRYSEMTGYLWTDEKGMVGGHDLIERFYHLQCQGKYAAFECVVHGGGDQ